MEGNTTQKDVSFAQAETVTASPPMACLDRTYNRRRSSILKPAKLRNPLQELDFNPSEDTENTVNVTRKLRRVSFAAGMQVKEFVEVHTETETMTLWGSSYEQIFGHSDTSHHSDVGPPEESIAVNNIPNISTLVTGKINTAVTNLIKPPNDQRSNGNDGLNVSENSINVGINKSYQNKNGSNHVNYTINNRRKGGVSFSDTSSVSSLENRHEILSSECTTSSLRFASSITREHNEDGSNVTKTPVINSVDVSRNQSTSFGQGQSDVMQDKIHARSTRLWQSQETVNVRDDNKLTALDLTTTKPVNMSTTYLESANCSYTSDYMRKYLPNTSYRKESEIGCLNKTTIFDKTGFLGLMDLTETVGDNCEVLIDQQQSNRTAYEDNMDFTEPISEKQFRENSQLNKTGLVHDSDVSSSLDEVVHEECDPKFNTTVGTLSKTIFEGDMDFTEAIHSDSCEDQTINVLPSSGIANKSFGNKTMFDTEMDLTEPVNKVCLESDTENNVHITNYASSQKILSRGSYCAYDSDTDDVMMATDDVVSRFEKKDGEQVFSNNDDMDFTEPLRSFPPADSPLQFNDENAEDHFKARETYEVDELHLTKSFKHPETRDSEESFVTFDNTGDGDNMDSTETINTISQQVQTKILNQTDLGDNVRISNNTVFSGEECQRKFDKTVYVGDMDLTEVVGNISKDMRESLLSRSTSSTHVENMDMTMTASVSQSDCVDSRIEMKLSTSNCSIQNKKLECDYVSDSEQVVSELDNICSSQTQEKMGNFEEFDRMVCQNDTLSTQTLVSSNIELEELDLAGVKVNENDVEDTVNKYGLQSTTEPAQYEELENVHLRLSCLPASFTLGPQAVTSSPDIESVPGNEHFLCDHSETFIVKEEVSKSTPKLPGGSKNAVPEITVNSNSIVNDETAVLEEKEVEELSPCLSRFSQKRNYQANANENTPADELVKIESVSPPKKICHAPINNFTSGEMKNKSLIEESERIVPVQVKRLCNELDVLPSIVTDNQMSVMRTSADCVSYTIDLQDLSTTNANLVEKVPCENLSSNITIPNIKAEYESYLLTDSESLTLQIETSSDKSQTCLSDAFNVPNVVSSVNMNSCLNQSDILEENANDSLKDTSLGILELENPEFGTIEHENVPFAPDNDSLRLPSIHSTSTMLQSPATTDYNTYHQHITINKLPSENVKSTATAVSTSMVEHSKQNNSLESVPCVVGYDSDSSNRTEHKEKKATSPLANDSVSDTVELKDEGSVEPRTNTLEVREQMEIPEDETYLKSPSPDLVPFEKPQTVEEVIKFNELRPYLWRIKVMKDDEWIFTFFYKSLDLVMKLDASNEDKYQHKVISQLYFSSSCKDESNAFCRFTHYALMQKFGTDTLGNLCATTEDVLPTLTTISQEVQKITTLMKDLHALENSYEVKMVDQSATFDIASLKINTLFVVSIDMRDHWEVILPAMVNIKQIVGNVNEAEIRQLAKGVRAGPHCLRDYVRYVHKYIETLELYGGSYNSFQK